MLIKLLIISVILIAAAFAFLGIRILLRPGGKFPDTHVGHNKEMRKRGIRCAQIADMGCNPVNNSEACAACEENIRGEKEILQDSLSPRS